MSPPKDPAPLSAADYIQREREAQIKRSRLPSHGNPPWHENPNGLWGTRSIVRQEWRPRLAVCRTPTCSHRGKQALPPWDDIIQYKLEKHLKEFKKNIQRQGTPGELQIVLQTIISKYFDVFPEKGMQSHICGFEFKINTGTVKPICYRQPVYGPHKSRVITALVATLEKKKIIEDRSLRTTEDPGAPL